MASTRTISFRTNGPKARLCSSSVDCRMHAIIEGGQESGIENLLLSTADTDDATDIVSSESRADGGVNGLRGERGVTGSGDLSSGSLYCGLDKRTRMGVCEVCFCPLSPVAGKLSFVASVVTSYIEK